MPQPQEPLLHYFWDKVPNPKTGLHDVRAVVGRGVEICDDEVRRMFPKAKVVIERLDDASSPS